MVGIISGMVTRRNSCQGEAPSMRAASKMSVGSDSSPARKSRKQNGVQCQMSTAMTVSSAVRGSPSQSFGGMPTSPITWFTSPKSKLSISFQIAPMTMPGMRMGRMKTARKNTRPRSMRLTRTARQQADHHLAADGADGEQGRVDDPRLEQGIVQQLRIVREADRQSRSPARSTRRHRRSW